jgi:hypothetical protein
MLLPAKVYANEGLCQILFFSFDEPCESAMPAAGQVSRTAESVFLRRGAVLRPVRALDSEEYKALQWRPYPLHWRAGLSSPNQ